MLALRDNREKCVAHDFIVEVAEAHTILEIHEPVANVIRRLDEENERMPRPAFRRALDQPAVLRDR